MEDRSEGWKKKLQPMAGPHWPIRCGHEFSSDDLALLRAGMWPRDMDDRWIVLLEDNVLRCWRSWTGLCIYETTISATEDGGGRAPLLLVLDDATAYQRASTDDSERERFEGVISQVLKAIRDADAVMEPM
ncbi:hypothetical protein [Pseudoxanthomonas mexicana]